MAKLKENSTILKSTGEEIITTKEEVDKKLENKADINHTHSKSQITDFPSSLPADGGTADRANILNIPDTKNVSETPGQLQKRGVTGAFKYRNKVGNPPVSSTGNYVFIITIAGYGSSTDGSGGWPVQLAFGRNDIALRYGTSSTAWSDWYEIAKNIDIPINHVGDSPPSNKNQLWIDTNI